MGIVSWAIAGAARVARTRNRGSLIDMAARVIDVTKIINAKALWQP
jgi:hypothetical protein